MINSQSFIPSHLPCIPDGRLDLFLQKTIANKIDKKASAAPNSSMKYAVIAVALVIRVKND